VGAEIRRGRGTQLDLRFASDKPEMIDEDVDHQMREREPSNCKLAGTRATAQP